MAITAWLGACVPEVHDDDSLVATPRVLAIRATPAEALPLDSVHYDALYVDKSGVVATTPLDWALCTERKSLAELGPINRACLTPKDKSLSQLAKDSASADAELPNEACQLFGPESAPAMGDEPAGRPADPDPTGGYYQPVRVFDPDEGLYTIFESRVTCSLPGVTQQQFAAYNRRYRPNENPEIGALFVTNGDAGPLDKATDNETPAKTIKPNTKLELRVNWAKCSAGNECGDKLCGDQEDVGSCPDDCNEIHGCSGAEHYLYFDRDKRDFELRIENMRVSWYASGGTFDDARTARDAADAKRADSTNAWTAPAHEGLVHLWVVLRDDRGGTAWQEYLLNVQR